MKALIVNNYSEEWRVERLYREVGKLAKADLVKYSSLVYTDWRDYDVIILSGSQADLVQGRNLVRFRRELELVREAEVPVLGICFGHQLIGRAFGSGLKRADKFYKGFYRARIVKEDAILSGLGKEAWFYESHGWVLEPLAEALEVLAEGDGYRVECIRHRERPIYGIQAHPERYDRSHPDGATVLRNFLALGKDF